MLVLILVLAAAAFTADKVIHALYPLEYSEYVETYAAEYGVDPYLVYAVIKCESGYDTQAVSSADAKGLMQLTDDTFRWVMTKTGETDLEVDDLFDPQINIRYGVKLLSLHLQEFGGQDTAMAAYHAGRTTVTNWLKNPAYSANGDTLDVIPYQETASYVERVERTKEVYKHLYRKD